MAAAVSPQAAALATVQDPLMLSWLNATLVPGEIYGFDCTGIGFMVGKFVGRVDDYDGVNFGTSQFIFRDKLLRDPMVVKIYYGFPGGDDRIFLNIEHFGEEEWDVLEAPRTTPPIRHRYTESADALRTVVHQADAAAGERGGRSLKKKRARRRRVSRKFSKY